MAKKLRKEALGHISGLSKVAGVELCTRLVRAGLAPSRAARAAAGTAAAAVVAADSKEAAVAAKAAGTAATAELATNASTNGSDSPLEWLSSLLETQLFFLESLALQQAAGGKGTSTKARRRFQRATKSVESLVLHWGEVGQGNRPALLQAYFNIVASNDSNLTSPTAAAAASTSSAGGSNSSAFAGLSVLGPLCLNPANVDRLPDGVSVAWREALLQRYREVVWPSAQGQTSLPLHVLQSFAPLLPWLLATPKALAGDTPTDGQEADSTSLLASIVKLLKKCPEAVVPALASLTQSVQVWRNNWGMTIRN